MEEEKNTKQSKYLKTSPRVKLHQSHREEWGEVLPACNPHWQDLFLAAYLNPFDIEIAIFRALSKYKCRRKIRLP